MSTTSKRTSKPRAAKPAVTVAPVAEAPVAPVAEAPVAPVAEAPVAESRSDYAHFVGLGRNYRRAKYAAIAALAAIKTEEGLDWAYANFTAGYIADILYPSDTPEAEAAGLAKAWGVMGLAPYDANGNPSKDGRVRKTLAEHRACGAAREALMQVRRAAGLVKTSKQGGANNPTGSKGKPEAGKPEAGKPEAGKPEAGKPEAVKVTDLKQVTPIVRDFRIAWAALVVQAQKLENFPIEAGDISSQIVGLMTKFEAMISK